MTRFIKWSCAVAVAAVLSLSGVAQASDYCQPTYVIKKVVSYKTVTCYETRSEAYTVCVTRYDHCGYAYNAYETRYRNFQVPVYKQVAVVSYVKVPVSY